MLASLVFAGVSILSPPQQAPLLTIPSVRPRTSDDQGCAVSLHNPHTRAAVAWILERLPYRDAGSTADNALAPAAALLAGATQEIWFPCADGELPAIEVAAVIYEDHLVAGDREALAARIVKPRMAKAAGLEELSNLLRHASATAGTAPTPEPHGYMADLVKRSGGPNITSRVQAEALTALSRVAARQGAAASASFVTTRDQLIAELAQSISALRAVRLQEGR